MDGVYKIIAALGDFGLCLFLMVVCLFSNVPVYIIPMNSDEINTCHQDLIEVSPEPFIFPKDGRSSLTQHATQNNIFQKNPGA